MSFSLPILIFGFFGFKIGISDSEMNFLIINRLTCKGLSNQPRNYLVSVLCGQTCSRQVQSQFHPFANAFEFCTGEDRLHRKNLTSRMPGPTVFYGLVRVPEFSSCHSNRLLQHRILVISVWCLWMTNNLWLIILSFNLMSVNFRFCFLGDRGGYRDP